MSRHVYRPPRGSFSRFFAILGGVLATIGVFIAIPLTQKLNDIFDDSSTAPPELVVEPPEEQSFDTETPPDEPEPEPEPEEPVEEPGDLDFSLDLEGLTAGTGGSLMIELPKFALKNGDDPFDASAMDSPPMPVTKIPPVYPRSLISKNVGGRVLVAATVDANGTVTDTSIRQSSGHAALDQAAIDAVSKWKFKPGVRSGRRATATCVVPFNFEVKKN
jgi:protein TonB